MKVKKFSELYIIKEDLGMSQLSQGSSWGFGDMSDPNGGSTSPRDKDLALDAYDTFNTNLKYTMNRYIDLSKNIFGNVDSDAYMNYTHAILDDISNFCIMNIVNNNDVSLTIYFKFDINEESFHGKIENYDNESNWTIISNFLRIPAIRNVRDLHVRFKQLIKTVLDNFFEIKRGLYILNKEMYMYDITGNRILLDEGTEVEIDKIYQSNNEFHVIYNNNEYTISGIVYYLFHYYFSHKETRTIKF